MGDTPIFVWTFTFLFITEFFVAGYGFETGALNAPNGLQSFGDPFSTGSATTTVKQCNFFQKLAGSFIPILGLITKCSLLTGLHVPVISATVDFLQNVVAFVVAFFAFFVQFIQYQIQILPTWLNLFILGPTLTTLLYIGYRAIRGQS